MCKSGEEERHERVVDLSNVRQRNLVAVSSKAYSHPPLRSSLLMVICILVHWAAFPVKGSSSLRSYFVKLKSFMKLKDSGNIIKYYKLDKQALLNSLVYFKKKKTSLICKRLMLLKLCLLFPSTTLGGRAAFRR